MNETVLYPSGAGLDTFVYLPRWQEAEWLVQRVSATAYNASCFAGEMGFVNIHESGERGTRDVAEHVHHTPQSLCCAAVHNPHSTR